MKVILDTHPLITGLLDPLSAASRIIQMIIGGSVTLHITDAILNDYHRAVSRTAFGIDPAHAQTLMAFFNCSNMADAPQPPAGEDAFLSAALMPHAEWWIVADAGMESPAIPDTVPMITAEDFLNRCPSPVEIERRTGPANFHS